MDTREITTTGVTKECAICGLTTDEPIIVCPEDGSALITHKPDPYIGKTLAGRFEVQSLIGSGGMGNVYKAIQKPVERMVAVKILHTEKLQKRDSVLRFHQEAKAAASLSHPNIVGFFHFDLTEDNIPFIVMDYIEGTPLDKVLKDVTLPINRFIEIFSQTCDALQHAHTKGVIHRDIKPSNIMLVTTDDGTDLVKILDFGIAKLLPRENSVDRIALTQTGELFGSPQYMSPEQFAGRKLDERSDMYSLGCVMYEALAGKPPVSAESLIELVHQHTHERPASLKSIRTDIEIPQQLEAVIFKTLEKEPEQRFPSMAALKHNLEFIPKFAEDEKLIPVKTEPQKKTPKLPWKMAAGIAAGVLVASGAGIAFMLYAINPPGDTALDTAFIRTRLKLLQAVDPGNAPAALPLAQKLRDAYAVRNQKSEALSMSDRAVDYSRGSTGDGWQTARELLRRAQIKEQFEAGSGNADFRSALEMLHELAKKNRQKQNWTANVDPNQPIDDTIMELDKKLSESTWEDRLLMADDHVRAGKLELVDYPSLITDQLTAKQKLQLADSMAAAASEFSVRGKDADTILKDAIKLRTEGEPDGEQSEAVALLKRKLGLYYLAHAQISTAETTLAGALDTALALNPHSQLTVDLYRDLSEVYKKQSDFKQAEEFARLAETAGKTADAPAPNTTP